MGSFEILNDRNFGNPKFRLGRQGNGNSKFEAWSVLIDFDLKAVLGYLGCTPQEMHPFHSFEIFLKFEILRRL
jgi:hypothetical protein